MWTIMGQAVAYFILLIILILIAGFFYYGAEAAYKAYQKFQRD
jgi:hypothetical protein